MINEQVNKFCDDRKKFVEYTKLLTGELKRMNLSLKDTIDKQIKFGQVLKKHQKRLDAFKKRCDAIEPTPLNVIEVYIEHCFNKL
jgi:hypothetical protein